jgi:hypothetical protein
LVFPFYLIVLKGLSQRLDQPENGIVGQALDKCKDGPRSEDFKTHLRFFINLRVRSKGNSVLLAISRKIIILKCMQYTISFENLLKRLKKLLEPR